MAPTESDILNQYLLTSASLPSFLTIQELTALFPRSQQSSPQVRTLYRDLQAQRNALIANVEASIENEVKEGRRQRRIAIKQRREAEAQEIDDEVEIERALFGPLPNDRKHNLRTIVPELESAAEDAEVEIRHLEEEEARLLETVRQTVGSLSDLRYSRLSNSKLRDEILEGLKNVEKTCQGKT
ncbi:hypothetical protein MKZ38_006390 [Zalerion maritima]|uniref:Cnl2/NKP2 family protein n=1 Tax=Zalerion maritima TaxID=339359 RepID=A0AAD5RJX3_9PEZI|nr:hypothetical protein MKZ38_006390 [Zalerion maritima]